MNKKIKKNLNVKYADINKPLYESRDIICPECGENALIKIDNYKIKIFGCKNYHIRDNILLDEFYDCQEEGLSKIICDGCNDTITNNPKFFRCINCNINSCNKCLNKHHNHYYIKYEQNKNYCKNHFKMKYSYCKTCSIFLCKDCENVHNKENHQIIQINKLNIDKNYVEELIKEMENDKI